jgi:hypothetical protein
MPGTLAGFYFKAVMSPMLTANVLFPEYKARVDRMVDDEWYSWDEYKRIVTTVANKLTYTSVCHIGMQIMASAKPLFVEQGFTSPDAFLKDWYVLVAANIKDVPEEDPPRTIEYTPGFAVIEASDAQPLALVEGYLRGAVKYYGGYLIELDAEEFERAGKTRYRWKVRWENR